MSLISSIPSFLLIVIGFGLVIFVHELGHYLAAKWAGIRVHAFAIGFGSAICSWRKGLGFRLGSSEAEYLRLAGVNDLARAPRRVETPHTSVSPTEYRLNWFPLGGYVKMLGQEDANPAAASQAPDSFTSVSIPKRMVVISAGVLMNIVLAAVLFMMVFLVGMREVAPVVGGFTPDSAAQEAGLRPGDLVLSANGDRTETFRDLVIAAAMSRSGEPVSLTVRRPGTDEPLSFQLTPRDTDADSIREFGIIPGQSAELVETKNVRADEKDQLRQMLQRHGLDRAGPGAELVAVNGEPVQTVTAWGDQRLSLAHALERAASRSGGNPVDATFRTAAGETVTLSLQPQSEMQTALADLDGGKVAFQHILGFVPPMEVLVAEPRAARQGLRAGDIFARIDSVEWPSPPRAVEIIRAKAGESIEATILRDGERIDLRLKVGRDGRIGFSLSGAAGSNIVTRLPLDLAGASPADFPVSTLHSPIVPGARLIAVGDQPVSNYADFREAIKRRTRDALDAGRGATIPVTMKLVGPAFGADGLLETQEITLSPDDVKAIHQLGWNLDTVMALFQRASFEMRAGDPWHATLMGIRHTHRYVMMTYLTFKRLITGDVAVSAISGPVGIVHIGTRFASQGVVYLLFFLGLLSANLAVINFLPIPIVDGGLFVMLCVEAVTRRPVPVKIQEMATIVGLLLIATVFLVVTYNDIVRLFAG